PRIVIDTNILVGAMLNATDGANREVLRHCLLRKAHPLLGAALFHEYEDLMARNEILEKSPLPPLEREALFASLLSVCEWVRVFYL
ncbi:MAG TPA: PIN domain-containing protein, partial [Bacteroidia bacterium]|nr:PIN domain-containing protein [Bacteroidia bacterium]